LSASAGQEVSSVAAPVQLGGETGFIQSSTINTVIEDTGEVLDVQPYEGVVPYLYPLPDQTPQAMLERLYHISTYAWATSAPVTTYLGSNPVSVLNVHSLLHAKDMNLAVFNFFAYYRADCEISFRLNTNQFYSGALMFTAYPGDFTSSRHLNDNYLNSGVARSWMKPKILSAQNQDTVVMRLPWVDPHRFGPATTMPVVTPAREPLVPWMVSIDIIAPLRVASISAPDSINLSIHAKFVNTQLLVPYDTGSSHRAKVLHDAVQRQSSGPGELSIRRPHTRTVKVHKSGGRQAPAESAGISGSQAVSSTISTGIHGTELVLGMLKHLQPLASMAFTLAAMFDKPNISAKPQKLLTQFGLNMPHADMPDQAVPLTLYKASYLGADPALLPDGRAWTFREIAMTPALSQSLPFTSLDDIAAVNLPDEQGTPHRWVRSLHMFGRASTRVRLQFYCSKFLSARFLVVYAPRSNFTAGTQILAIDNNISRLIDVKGDTTVDFTFPFIWPVDYIDQSSFAGSLLVQLYEPIASTDTVADPTIDLCIWTAAGPDCQFTTTFIPTATAFLYPDPPDRQCDIQQDFQKEFPPFVENCSYMTDQHYTMSEQSEYVTDVLKRYTSSAYTAASTLVTEVSMRYSPQGGTVASNLLSAFVYYRGGSSYKIVYPEVPTTTTQTGLMGVIGPGSEHQTWNTGTDPFMSSVGAVALFGNENQSMDFSIPWNWIFPYGQAKLYEPQLSTSLAYSDPVFGYPVDVSRQSALFKIAGTVGQFPTIYTAARDDFSLGMLQPPNDNTFINGTSSSRKMERPTRPLAPAEKAVLKAVGVGSFFTMAAKSSPSGKK